MIEEMKRLISYVLISVCLCICANAQQPQPQPATPPATVELPASAQQEIAGLVEGAQVARLQAEAAQARLEAAQARLQAQIFRLMALLKLSPNEYEIQNSNGQLIFMKKEQKPKQ
jgi:hypothetical protein